MARTVACLTFSLFVLLVLSLPTAHAARVTSITLCEQVSDDGAIPINVTSRFSGAVPSIHAIVNIDAAKQGTTIRGVWVSVDAIEVPGYEIDAAEAVAQAGDAVVHFALSRPDNGWPTGNYKLDVYMDGQFAASAPFVVTGDAVGETAAGSTTSAAAGPKAAGQKPAEKPAPRQTGAGQSTAPSQAGAPGAPAELQKTGGPQRKNPASALLGTWQCQMPTGTSTLVFESPTHLNLDGYRAKYSLVQNAIRVTDEDGTADYPYRLQGNVLTIDFPEGYELQFTKVSERAEYTDPADGGEGDYDDGGYDEGQGTAGGYVPANPGEAVQPLAGGDVDLMNHFAGTWWNATRNTETNVTLTPDGRYFESSSASYSGGSSDQYGNTDMSWGAAGDQQAQGTWTVRGTREQGVLTIFFSNGNQREINYKVHVENGEVYWSEYFFNGELYGKK